MARRGRRAGTLIPTGSSTERAPTRDRHCATRRMVRCGFELLERIEVGDVPHRVIVGPASLLVADEYPGGGPDAAVLLIEDADVPAGLHFPVAGMDVEAVVPGFTLSAASSLATVLLVQGARTVRLCGIRAGELEPFGALWAMPS